MKNSTEPKYSDDPILGPIEKILKIPNDALVIFILVLIGVLILGVVICLCCCCCYVAKARKEAKKKKRPKSKGLFRDQIPGFQNDSNNEIEYVGELQYTLEYNIKKKSLKVGMVEARDLVTDGEGPCNPFCRCSITSKNGDSKTFETKVVENTRDPCWSQNFDWGLTEVKSSSLLFEVFTRDAFGNNIKIGRSTVELATKDLISFLGKTSEESTLLEKCPTEYVGLGDICIVLRQSPEDNKFFVTILEAKKLRLPGLLESELPEVWVSVKLLDGKKSIQSHHTSNKKHTRDPYFNETLEFQTKNSLLAHKKLQCSIKYRNSLKIKYTLGTVIFNEESEMVSTKKQWSEMLKFPRKPIAMWHTLQKAKK